MFPRNKKQRQKCFPEKSFFVYCRIDLKIILNRICKISFDFETKRKACKFRSKLKFHVIILRSVLQEKKILCYQFSFRFTGKIFCSFSCYNFPFMLCYRFSFSFTRKIFHSDLQETIMYNWVRNKQTLKRNMRLDVFTIYFISMHLFLIGEPLPASRDAFSRCISDMFVCLLT